MCSLSLNFFVNNTFDNSNCPFVILCRKLSQSKERPSFFISSSSSFFSDSVIGSSKGSIDISFDLCSLANAKFFIHSAAVFDICSEFVFLIGFVFLFLSYIIK